MKLELACCSVVITGVISSAHEMDRHQLHESQNPGAVSSCRNYEKLNHSYDGDETQNDVPESGGCLLVWELRETKSQQ